MRKLILAVAVLSFACAGSAFAQQASSDTKTDKKNPQAACPMHDAHSSMSERGEKGMGFSQSATTHHFLLRPDGGAIQVETNNPDDAANRDNIRMHLTHIAHAFASGDFDIPMFVHDTVPPGVPEMKKLEASIHYAFEETPSGGRVMITTADKDALAAVHQFLRFQIEAHKTGDPVDVR
ncbi:MAG: hypothetical protein ACRD59_03470 [Candidatus Acidiferrales bacterium]